MPESELIELNDDQLWMNVLSRCDKVDFYHLPDIHRLAQILDQGKPFRILLDPTQNFNRRKKEAIARMEFEGSKMVGT